MTKTNNSFMKYKNILARSVRQKDQKRVTFKAMIRSTLVGEQFFTCLKYNTFTMDSNLIQ